MVQTGRARRFYRRFYHGNPNVWIFMRRVFSYGSDHQECMMHIERRLRECIENEKNLTWPKQMLELIQEMIHENNTAPDNNLCERKTRTLKGKFNQSILLRSFEHLVYFCECLSVLDYFATDNWENLYESIKEIFRKQKPMRPKCKKHNLPMRSCLHIIRNEGLIRAPGCHALFPHPVKSNIYPNSNAEIIISLLPSPHTHAIIQSKHIFYPSSGATSSNSYSFQKIHALFQTKKAGVSEKIKDLLPY